MKQTGLPGDGLVVFVKAGCETNRHPLSGRTGGRQNLRMAQG